MAGRTGLEPERQQPNLLESWGFTPARACVRCVCVGVLECPRCGARTRLLAAIHPPDTTTAILESLDLPARAPPLAGARRNEELPDPWETGFEAEDF